MPLMNLIINTKQSLVVSEVTVVQVAAKIAKKELRETGEAKKVALGQMITWIKNNNDIEDVRIDENFLLRYLSYFNPFKCDLF